MASTTNDFIHFLVSEMEATESTEFVDELLAGAKARILAGEGEVSSLISTGLNGKSFGRQIHMSALDLAIACRAALAIYGESGATTTYADFSSL